MKLLVLALLVGCGDKDDSGGPADGGALDGGASDGGASDGGASDGGASDGGTADGGTDDGGAADGGAADGGAEAEVVADFSLPDLNPGSARYGQLVSPRNYLEEVSGWYFIHAT